MTTAAWQVRSGSTVRCIFSGSATAGAYAAAEAARLNAACTAANMAATWVAEERP